MLKKMHVRSLAAAGNSGKSKRFLQVGPQSDFGPHSLRRWIFIITKLRVLYFILREQNIPFFSRFFFLSLSTRRVCVCARLVDFYRSERAGGTGYEITCS